MYNVSARDASSGSEKYDGKNSKFLSTSKPTLEFRLMFSIFSPENSENTLILHYNHNVHYVECSGPITGPASDNNN